MRSEIIRINMACNVESQFPSFSASRCSVRLLALHNAIQPSNHLDCSKQNVYAEIFEIRCSRVRKSTYRSWLDRIRIKAPPRQRVSTTNRQVVVDVEAEVYAAEDGGGFTQAEPLKADLFG